MILESGFWTGLTLYPQTKVSPPRAVDILETHGNERICVASACDWGPSVPHRRATVHDGDAPSQICQNDLIHNIVYENPFAFLSQSPHFTFAAANSACRPHRHGALGMRLAYRPDTDLTYCTNIHPGNGWLRCLQPVKQYTPALKQRLFAERAFRPRPPLVERRKRRAAHRERPRRVRRFLEENGLYVALINGFPTAPSTAPSSRKMYSPRIGAIPNASITPAASSKFSRAYCPQAPTVVSPPFRSLTNHG